MLSGNPTEMDDGHVLLIMPLSASVRLLPANSVVGVFAKTGIVTFSAVTVETTI